MKIGSMIQDIRKERNMTQEEFGKLFFVTRQTVSNWENEKSYPDLQVLVRMSEEFGISLDRLLKEDKEMVKAIDKERMLGAIKRGQSVRNMLTGAGTGIIVSCLFSPDSGRRIIMILLGLAMIGIGWWIMARCDKRMSECIENLQKKE